jgi:hypothetical protein
MFPIDPNSPSAPDRSEYIRRAYPSRAAARDGFATFALVQDTPVSRPRRGPAIARRADAAREVVDAVPVG